MSTLSDSLLDNTPAGTPPAGEHSNFVDPPSAGYWIIITVVACLAVTLPLVLMRVAAKLMGRKRLDLADYTSIVAEAGFIVYCGLLVKSEAIGGGRHMWDISLASLVQGLQLIDTLEVIYCPVLFIAKLSVLLQIRRIFTGSQKRGFVSIATAVLIWTNALFYTAVMFATIFACTPREKIWMPWLPGTCLNQNMLVLSNASLNVASDLLILILPIYATSRLNLAFDRKLKVSAIFAFAAFALAAGVMRLVASINLVNNIADFSYNLVPLGCWSLGEIATVIGAGCMPSLPQFTTLLSKKLRSTKRSYLSYGSDKAAMKGRLGRSVDTSGTAYTLNSVDGYKERAVFTLNCSLKLSKKMVPVKHSSSAHSKASHRVGPRPVDASADSYQSRRQYNNKKPNQYPTSIPLETYQSGVTRPPTPPASKEAPGSSWPGLALTVKKQLFPPKPFSGDLQDVESGRGQASADDSGIVSKNISRTESPLVSPVSETPSVAAQLSNDDSRHRYATPSITPTRTTRPQTFREGSGFIVPGTSPVIGPAPRTAQQSIDEHRYHISRPPLAKRKPVSPLRISHETIRHTSSRSPLSGSTEVASSLVEDEERGSPTYRHLHALRDTVTSSPLYPPASRLPIMLHSPPLPQTPRLPRSYL